MITKIVHNQNNMSLEEARQNMIKMIIKISKNNHLQEITSFKSIQNKKILTHNILIGNQILQNIKDLKGIQEMKLINQEKIVKNVLNLNKI